MKPARRISALIIFLYLLLPVALLSAQTQAASDNGRILTNEAMRPSLTSVFMDSKENSKTKLGIDQTAFTLNGKSVFLYGISYYGALGAQESFIQKDLADVKKNGFNWIRIWANWPGSTNDISAVDDYGKRVEQYMKKLKWIVQECDKAGIVVDVILAHSNNTNGRSLKTLEAHEQAVRSIVTALKSYQNWYLDLANERDIGDSRFVSFKDLKKMRETAKALYPGLLVTASAGNDISRDDLNSYLNLVEVDFISPHRPRTPESVSETAVKTMEYLDWMKSMGKMVPLHYQEPFRRGYSNWQPVMKDYVTDFFGAKEAGAAGWCFHNGDQKEGTEHKPARSFDLHEKRLFDQLDPEELLTIRALAARMRK